MVADYINLDELASCMIRDMSQYSDEVVKKSEETAKAVRNQMKPMLEAKSPVRQYSKNTQVVKRIVVHRVPGVAKAVRETKEAKNQPGYFKQGWAYGNIKLKNGREIYGVRNRAMPTVTHLLNFGHNLISHKSYRGSVGPVVRNTDNKHTGNVGDEGFVDAVQSWGMEELDRRLSEFLDKE